MNGFLSKKNWIIKCLWIITQQIVNGWNIFFGQCRSSVNFKNLLAIISKVFINVYKNKGLKKWPVFASTKVLHVSIESIKSVIIVIITKVIQVLMNENMAT